MTPSIYVRRKASFDGWGKNEEKIYIKRERFSPQRAQSPKKAQWTPRKL